MLVTAGGLTRSERCACYSVGMKYGVSGWTPTKEQRIKMRKEAAQAARRLAKIQGIPTAEDCLADPVTARRYMRVVKDRFKTEIEGVPRLRDAIGVPGELR